MNKKQLYELIAETNSEHLDFLPENVKKEIDELKEKIDEAYKNSKIIKEYKIPKYKVCSEILIVENTEKFVKRT